jgi:Tfp pilus assembly protein PilN
VLQAIDAVADPTVPLLSVEAQGQTRTLRLTGEAKQMSDVVRLVGRLGASPLIDTATLSHHEERMAGTVKVIRFSLDLTWKPSP